jgi:hypothetical protein
MKSTTPEIELAQRWAIWYKSMGWQPIPSKEIGGSMRPFMKSYTTVRDEGSDSIPSEHWWSDGIQLALGVRSGSKVGPGPHLCVVDLDGPEARDVWEDMTRFRPVRTWEVERDPDGGKHVWFLVPDGVESLRHHAFLWRLEDDEGHAHHRSIELLGDKNLIAAPPTPRGDTAYRFLPGRSPWDMDWPATLPGWVVEMANREGARLDKAPFPAPEIRCLPMSKNPGRNIDVEAVIANTDPVSLADLIGIRLVSGTPNASGWMRCHSVFRADRNPSAMFGVGDHRGPRYYDLASLGDRSVGIFELAAMMGIYPDTCSAINGIGEVVLGSAHSRDGRGHGRREDRRGRGERDRDAARGREAG